MLKPAVTIGLRNYARSLPEKIATVL